MGGGGVLLIYLTVFQNMAQLDAQGMNLLFFCPSPPCPSSFTPKTNWWSGRWSSLRCCAASLASRWALGLPGSWGPSSFPRRLLSSSSTSAAGSSFPKSSRKIPRKNDLLSIPLGRILPRGFFHIANLPSKSISLRYKAFHFRSNYYRSFQKQNLLLPPRPAGRKWRSSL